MDGPVRKNEFLILDGGASGTALPIPRGNVTIGSGEDANLQLMFPGVSHVHASLIPMNERVILADGGSGNPTLVNGQPISVPTEIVDGDLLQFGSVRVLFRTREAPETVQGHHQEAEGAGGGNGSSSKETGSSKESVGAAVLFAVVINVIGLVGNGAAAFLTELTPTWSWFVTPVAGLVVAVVTEVVGHYRKSPATVPAEPRGQPRSQPRDRSRQQPGAYPRGRSPRTAPHTQPRRRLLPTVLITVLLLGGGTWLLTAGASYAVGYVSGKESGVQRLAARAAVEVRGVNVTVLGVQTTPHFTRVEILVRNRTGVSISLPLFRNCALTAQDGTAFDADPSRSKWGSEIAADGQRKGTINFEGQLPQGATTVSLGFATVFGAGTNLPRSITVPDISLSAMPDSTVRAGGGWGSR